MATDWLVYHYETSGGIIGEVTPLNLRWGVTVDGPGYITYDMPIANNHLAHQLRTKPYRTDWQLLNRNGGQWITRGFHTEVTIDDYFNTRMMKVAGKDYLHYLERIMWPRDPNSNYRTSTFLDSTNGTVFDYTDTIDYLVYKLISEATGYVNYSFVPSFTGAPSPTGSGFRYRVEPGDTRTLWQHITDLFSLGDSTENYYLRLDQYGNYDFPSNLLPRYSTIDTPAYDFDANPRGGNCELVSFRHGGIRGTWFFGLASGPSAKKAVLGNNGMSAYRRWDISEEFTGPNAYTNLSTLVASSLEEALIPDIEIQVKWVEEPEKFSPWFREYFWPGVRVGLKADLGWIDINDTFTVMALECSVENDGVTEYTATLNLPLSST